MSGYEIELLEHFSFLRAFFHNTDSQTNKDLFATRFMFTYRDFSAVSWPFIRSCWCFISDENPNLISFHAFTNELLTL